MTVEVTAHSVKRSWSTGPDPARGPRPGRDPIRSVAGPPGRRGRPENAHQIEGPAICKNQSKMSNGWGRSIAKHEATGLKNSDGEGTRSDGKSAKWSSTSVQRECRLHGRNGHATRVGSQGGKPALAACRCQCHVVGPRCSFRVRPGARRGEPSAGTCKSPRRQLFSESVPRTCRSDPRGRRGARRSCARGPPGQILLASELAAHSGSGAVMPRPAWPGRLRPAPGPAPCQSTETGRS